MIKTYMKTGATTTASIYISETGEKLIVVPTNMNQKNKPVFYLRRGNPAQYVSGLFKTKNPTIFSGDIKDIYTGTKQLFIVRFQDKGDNLVIEGMA